jgi:hypothetical protein
VQRRLEMEGCRASLRTLQVWCKEREAELIL